MILARVRHPQTNGKLFTANSNCTSSRRSRPTERCVQDPRRTVWADLPKTDPVERFVEWFNHDRPHMSLDLDNLETPAQAFTRKISRTNSY